MKAQKSEAREMPAIDGKKSARSGKGERARRTAREICRMALFTAIIAVCAWISVPVGEIPVTLQTLGICLASAILGCKRGTAAVAAYIALGLCGVPVFAGFTGGAAKLLAPTGGYIVGFLFTGVIVGMASDLTKKRTASVRAGLLVLGMAAGVAVCYAFGTAWFMLFYRGGTITLSAALALCVVPYLVPDFIKILVAAFIAGRLEKGIRR